MIELKHMEIVIFGSIDEFKRKFRWLRVASTNKNTKVIYSNNITIALLYTDCIRLLRLVSREVRSDREAENTRYCKSPFAEADVNLVLPYSDTPESFWTLHH